MGVGYVAVDDVEERAAAAPRSPARGGRCRPVILSTERIGRDLGGRADEENLVGHIQQLAREHLLTRPSIARGPGRA